MDTTKPIHPEQENAPTNLVDFMVQYTKEQEQKGHTRKAEKYATSLRCFARFLGDKAHTLTDLDSDTVQAYETYMQCARLCPNTTSFYMRNLRAMYNQAVKEGYCRQRYPFKEVYTGVDKTIKRALPRETIRAIRDLPLKDESARAFARDLFMFSFYTRGMAFVDIAHLRKSDLHYGILSYRRRKTHQEIHIKWEPVMQEIVDRYGVEDSQYLLPILCEKKGNAHRQYLNAVHLVNLYLKEIGRKLELQAPLTTYVARHSWASIAYNKSIPTATISEALGHESEKTTRIYLSTLSYNAIDRANQLVLQEIAGRPRHKEAPPLL
jgi:integrase